MNKKYIVCVDDEKIVLDSLRVQLNRHFGNQFIYEFAESAQEALEILDELDNSDRLTMLISDWLMPEMKGDEFLTKVHQKNNQLKMILLTGHAKEDAVNELLQKIKNLKVVYKPWQENILIDEIKKNM